MKPNPPGVKVEVRLVPKGILQLQGDCVNAQKTRGHHLVNRVGDGGLGFRGLGLRGLGFRVRT